MAANTLEVNRNRMFRLLGDDIWLFGYGSLIYKADFEYSERVEAEITGWERRFWQGSHDHRGTEQQPGRVVTLVQRRGAKCKGVAYKINRQVLEQLDIREKNGYLRFLTELNLKNSIRKQGLMYVADSDNAAYLGPDSEMNMALQIAKSRGPSGANSDYLFNLAQALRELSASDGHVFSLEEKVLKILPGNQV